MPKARKNRGKSRKTQNAMRGDDPNGVRTARGVQTVTEYGREWIDDSSSDSEVEDTGKKAYKNKQRVMLLSSRGVAAQHRHLLNDFARLMPHGRKESKFDSKTKLHVINELAELQSCNNVMFFEVRRHQDMFLWMTKAPNGPSVKFLCSSVHPMNELQFIGNCLRGSRAVLSFDSKFDEEPELQLVKELFTQVFGVPNHHPHSTHHVDHVISFSVLDGRLWLRNYQIVDRLDSAGKSETVLMEIGPRLVLQLIRVFSGSFTGATLYKNPDYHAPAEIRRDARRAEAGKYTSRITNTKRREAWKIAHEREKDVLDDVFAE